MDPQWLFEIFSRYFSAGYGVPTAHQWPVFVLSKLALVILPLFAVRLFNRYLDSMNPVLGTGPLPGVWRIRAFFEKFLAHAMFYVGMGIPIIGFNAVMDIHRLIGFTLTNMFIHEVLPKIFSENRFKRLIPEWRKTLGVNLIINAVTLEFSVFRDKHGRVRVEESPHSKFRNFIQKTIHRDDGDGQVVEVVLRRFFVPKDRRNRFFVRQSPDFTGRLSCDTLGSCYRIDFADLADYAAPVYINDYGRRTWLWRPQYWTKFFNEIGGRSFMASPFQVIRKFFLVVFGTPLAFSAGNVLVHYYYGGTLNLHPLLYFNYGIIFAFTIGGMYGASVFSTLIELAAWQTHLVSRKYKKVAAYAVRPRSWPALKGVRSHNPYLNPDLFGAMLERHNKSYRRFRFLAGGILMGGICSWGFTHYYGQAFEHFIDTNVRSAMISAVAATGTGTPGIYLDETFTAAAKTFDDRDNRLFQTDSTLARTW